MDSRVVLKERKIFIDGKPLQIFSGAIHYFRVLPELWRDRLEKLVQCGFNCVETYMCWNLHELHEGKFDFSGILDFERFIHTAQELGLYVIVRPGPYICAEWDNGGFPYWLMNKPGIEFRRMNEPYLKAVKNYFDVILPKLAALQIDNGGPVILMQVENEYGSYGHDKDYILTLAAWMRDVGITIPLFTGDGAGPLYLQNGAVEGIPAMLTGGSLPLRGFDLLKKFRPDDPPFYMEFWIGWYDKWHEQHHKRSAENAASEFDDIVRAGGSVNMYMFHGGTNFGFYAGANKNKNNIDYTCDATSYDYDAPLTEWGDPTEKYFAFQKVVQKYFPEAKTGTPKVSKKIAYGKVDFTASAPLLENLDNLAVKQTGTSPLTMEQLEQPFGFVHYRTHVPGPLTTTLRIPEVRDFADLMIDGRKVKTVYRNQENDFEFPCFIPEEGIQVDILVENMGRVNYGPLSGHDAKGLTDGFSTDLVRRFGWEMWPLELGDLSRLVWQEPDCRPEAPCFHKGEFEVDEIADTFVRFPGERGVIFINGFNLGRYWKNGSNNALYLPAPLLKKGRNEIIVFETGILWTPYVELLDHPEL